MAEHLPQQLWPGWETVRLIGRGSYGAVYEIRRSLGGEEERAAVKHMSIPQDEQEIRELKGSFKAGEADFEDVVAAEEARDIEVEITQEPDGDNE